MCGHHTTPRYAIRRQASQRNNRKWGATGATLADVHRLLDVHHATSESLKHPIATIASEAPQELHWLMYIASLMYIKQPASLSSTPTQRNIRK